MLLSDRGQGFLAQVQGPTDGHATPSQDLATAVSLQSPPPPPPPLPPRGASPAQRCCTLGHPPCSP